MAASPAQQIIATLHGAGLTLALTPDLGLKIAPASNLTPELRDLIRTSKDILISWLHRDPANDPLPAPRAARDVEGEREAFEERAAIMEFDGGLSRAKAEARAMPCPLDTEEIDAFMARLAQFTDLGLSLEAAEALADKLVIRDREGDDRGICLECRHLVGGVRCSAAELAGLGVPSLRMVEVHTIRDRLQRCPGLLRR